MLPDELTPEHWPGHTLRSTYHRFDGAFKQRMNEFLRRS
jgi:phenylacetic acid degradation operon negative regulatory protein